MLLVYLDESYRRRQGYWLAACGVRDERIADLCAGIAGAAATIPDTFGIPADVELHAQHLYHGDGAFEPLKQAVRLRVQIYRRGLQALAASEPVVFLAGVRWNEELYGQDGLTTHRLAALRHLLDAVERHCRRYDERALIVADEEETSATDVVSVVRHHQQSQETPSRILDGPLFTPSHWSYGVQAGDLVAFLHTRREFGRDDGRPEDPRAQKQLDAWWSMVEPFVATSVCHDAPEELDRALAARLDRGSAR